MSTRRTLLLFLLLIFYLGSYLTLSRRGFEFADQAGVRGGFWFFEPKSTMTWEIANYGAVACYAPLIYVDYLCWGKRRPANVPLFGLSS